MPKYIDVENVRLTAVGTVDEDGDIYVSVRDVKRALDQTPTADVVPKSEVMKMVGGYYERCDECRTNCASAVAREIFEEIEKLSHEFMNNEHYIFGDMLWDIAELKKKYT